MRKLFITALVAVASVFGAMAQSSDGNYEFRRHFYLQAQGGAGFTVGENSFGKLISPAAALNIGYKFSPAFGLRLGASGWQAKGRALANYMTDYKFKYIQGNLDATLSLSNLICGFNPKRTLDLYAFLGVGFNHGFDNDEAIAINNAGTNLEYIWDKKNFVAGRGGLGLNVRLSDIVALNVEANAHLLSDHFNSKYGDNADWQFNGLVGLTINFGRSYTSAPVVVEEVTEAVEVVPAPQPVPTPKPEPAPAPAPKPQPKMTKDVFFLINSANVRPTEMPKVNELVAFLKANPQTRVAITGYADKETGSANYNMGLSERRAEAVAKILRDNGIADSRITVSAKGGTQQPFDVQVENRVAIAIAQ